MLPSALIEAMPAIAYCCPACRRDLERRPASYCCAACGREYGDRLGFPDFRLGPTPDVPEGDAEIAATLASRESELDFRGLLTLYRKLYPQATSAIEDRHTAHLAAESEQAREVMERLGGGSAYLDVGCGSGRYLEAAAAHFDALVGVDAALYQLVLSRRFLADAGVEAMLVAAQAERLPFADHTFAAAGAADVIEHVSAPKLVVAEMQRVLESGGGAYFSTPNRYSLTPDPHVNLWGLGFLPHERAVQRVKRKLGTDYASVHPRSYWEFRRVLRASFAEAVEIEAPRVGAAEAAGFSWGMRAAAALYTAVRCTPLLRASLRLSAPYFQAFCRKRSA